MRKALALLSGGLDSLLAAKLIMNQGLHVEGINFFTGFSGVGCVCIKRENKSLHNASWVADQLGIKLHVVDVVAEFQKVLANPQYGYGAHLNPCLDCKRFMVMQAFAWMKENAFDFLVTGEVIGQRPMSQRKDTLPIVAKNTDDLLLRPLCAKLLPISLPEREGWVNRDLLCNFSGRSRKPQMALAQQFGFTEYPQPAGGCILTDEFYTKRLRDLWKWQGPENKNYTLEDIMLLQVGRHLRPDAESNFKVIVGRDQLENECLEKYKDRYISMYSSSHIGPVVLCVGEMNAANMELAAKITAYFGKGRQAESVQITVDIPKETSKNLNIIPIPEIPSKWYI